MLRLMLDILVIFFASRIPALSILHGYSRLSWPPHAIRLHYVSIAICKRKALTVMIYESFFIHFHELINDLMT